MKMKFFIINASVGLLLLICLNCVSSKTIIKLTEKDAGAKIQLTRQQYLQIELKSNPSTGYSWVIAAIDSSIISQSSSPQYETHSQATGGAGNSILTFKPQKTGDFSLRLVYKRIWERNVAPRDSFFISGTVAP